MRDVFSRTLAIAVLAAAAAAQEPARDFAVHCGTLLVGDGTTVLHDAWLVVKAGKVVSAGAEAPPEGLPVVDARDKVVMPGIVAVDSDLSEAADSDYQVTPQALAVDAFDFDRKWQTALSGGVTTAYLSPGRQRLVSGQGAVVKLAGRDLVERVLDENNCLRVDFGDSGIRAPRVFEPVAHPTSDDPIEPSRIQTPTARISLLAELRALFSEAASNAKGTGGQGFAEEQYDEATLARVVGGKLPLRAAAFRAQDVRRALTLQKELGVRMVLEDPQEIASVAKLAAAQGVAAAFRVPVRFGQPTQGGEDQLDETPKPRPDAPAKAAAAGVKIGLAPAAGVSLRDYLLAVGIAVRHGLSREQALRAVGSDAAAILGVDQRVGSLAPGKDADFLLLSGDPLAIGTMVEATYVDGRRVFERSTESSVLAIRAGRIHDGNGHVFRNGLVIAQNGRIKAVGEDLAIPYGAKVIDLPDAVITPGFIDAFSHLGLAGEGTPVPGGAPGQPLQDAIAFDDPMFGPALAAGLTTVLVSGKDQGPVNGRVAAIKTGAADHDGMVLRAIVGQRLTHDGIGPNAIKALADQINRGKGYAKAWADYEKALAEWKTGKAPAEAPKQEAPKPEGEKEKAIEDPVTGTWEAEIDIQGQIRLKVALELKLEGTKVTGKVRIAFGNRELPAQEISSGSYEGGKLKIEFRGMGGTTTLEATVANDKLTGKITLGQAGEQDVTGTRTSKSAPTTTAAAPRREAKADPEGKPKAPKVDENLEPMRAVIEQRATLVVNCKRGQAIRDTIELLENEKLRYVLQDVEDLLDDASIAGSSKPTVLVGPEVVEENEGELRCVPAVLSDRDYTVLFGSDECAGARYLPLHATYAVRYGLSPTDALAALTSAPAKAFGIADRVGSLQKGLDADLVVFSGNPFELQSRVLLVVCNGRVVVDHREENQ
ncbi:MAG: amidohydrolase family protein [Planctomycetes bacterium]|nr:amidohydrolase family protein [Planctomycetota bacterium]